MGSSGRDGRAAASFDIILVLLFSSIFLLAAANDKEETLETLVRLEELQRRAHFLQHVQAQLWDGLKLDRRVN